MLLGLTERVPNTSWAEVGGWEGEVATGKNVQKGKHVKYFPSFEKVGVKSEDVDSCLS